MYIYICICISIYMYIYTHTHLCCVHPLKPTVCCIDHSRADIRLDFVVVLVIELP